MLRDGPALAIPDRDGETGPATRLSSAELLRGRPENGDASPNGLATLVVCLLDAKMPEVLADTHHETNNL